MSGFISAIQEGGPWMAPIIISFVFAMAIVAERFMVLLVQKATKKL